MTDDLENSLEEWGRAPAPKVDGAFANRLETRLREQVVDAEPQRSVFGWLLRPGVLAIGGVLLVVVIGLARNVPDVDPINVADNNGSTSTTTQPATTNPPTTAPPTSASTSTPPTTAAPTTLSPTTVAPTDAPPTTAPATTGTATTDAPSTTISPTTVPPTSISRTTDAPAIPRPLGDVSAERNGRRLTVTWRVDTTGSDVAGWVLLSNVNGDRGVLETSRNAATRRFVTTITNVDADYRIEGRNLAGEVVFDSGEILFSPDE